MKNKKNIDRKFSVFFFSSKNLLNVHVFIMGKPTVGPALLDPELDQKCPLCVRYVTKYIEKDITGLIVGLMQCIFEKKVPLSTHL